MQVYYAVEIITIVIFHTCFVRCIISWLCQQATTYTNLPPGAAYGIAAIDTFAIGIIPTYLLARFTVTIFSVNIIVYTLCVHFLAAMFATTPKPIIWIIMLYLYINKVFLSTMDTSKLQEIRESIVSNQGLFSCKPLPKHISPIQVPVLHPYSLSRHLLHTRSYPQV